MKIITTVGTSILTNCKKDGKTIDFSTLENRPTKGEPFEDAWEDEEVESTIKKIKKTVDNWSIGKGENASAEIASIFKIQQEIKQKIEIYLICTETVLSRLSAECIKFFFETKKNPMITIAKIKVVENLQIKNKIKFEREGLTHLFDEITTIAQNGDYWANCVLNITGGYKAVIPFLTIIGQIKAIPIYYIFEESDEDKYELLRMPQLPIRFDNTFLLKYAKYFIELQDLQIETLEAYCNKNNLPNDFKKYCVEEIDGSNTLIGLNGLGNFMLKEYETYFFVKIPLGCPIFNENIDKKKQVEIAIRQLKSDIGAISEPFETLKNPYIKHVSIEDSWVYKHQSPQLRIQYQYEVPKKELTIINYVFILSSADDKGNNSYEPRMKKMYPNFKQQIRDNETTYVGYALKS